MTVDLNNNLANDMLTTYVGDFPAGSFFQVRSGAPAGAENAAGGTLGAEITLPASPWAAVGSGSVSKQNSWTVAAVAAITAGHYRMKNAADTRREEGTVTATGGGGDATIDNTSIAVGQNVSVNTLTRTL